MVCFISKHVYFVHNITDSPCFHTFKDGNDALHSSTDEIVNRDVVILVNHNYSMNLVLFLLT